MKKACTLILICTIALPLTGAARTRHHTARRHRTSAAPYNANAGSSADLKAARARVAAQIKTLTHFLYLFGGIAKGVESVDAAVGTATTSPALTEQTQRNKARIRDSIRDVRQGLEKLESDLRVNSAMKTYFQYIAGVANLAEAAQNQVAADRFEDAGRLLLKAVDQLTDALAATR